jgi:hypothetical protein
VSQQAVQTAGTVRPSETLRDCGDGGCGGRTEQANGDGRAEEEQVLEEQADGNDRAEQADGDGRNAHRVDDGS